ncbi:hypothetical protein STRIP9103_02286 [Streptomyces ipomoeae 91-03]|uniref:Uncharacterized protein n=1 Tax=Streptomyces ipomoeae 91-03 TaxID=698759 RepID=L1KUW8_9ACTN|nr:hypothetical protein STRIP9103_02286 [Streptomyces ipomoeae 91-03]
MPGHDGAALRGGAGAGARAALPAARAHGFGGAGYAAAGWLPA